MKLNFCKVNAFCVVQRVVTRVSTFAALSLLVASSISSCTEDKTESENVTLKTKSEFIFGEPIMKEYWRPSDKRFLKSIYYDAPERVIHYRIARCLIYAESMGEAGKLFGIGNLFSSASESTYVTELPRVIMGFDGYPKYYEFALEQDGMVNGTIVVAASYNQFSAGIEYVFPYVINREYDAYPDMDIYADEYPDFYYGEFSQTGGRPKQVYNMYGDCMTEQLWTYTEEEKMDEMMEAMPDSDRICIEQFNSEHIRAVQEEMEYAKELCLHLKGYGFDDDFYNDEYVSQVERKKYDERIAQIMYNAMRIGFNGLEKKVLSEYENNYLRLTHWDGYCGPSALAFVYRGKYDHYPISEPSNYINILGDGRSKHFVDNISMNVPYAYYQINLNTCGLGFEEALNIYVERSREMDYGLSECFYRECIESWLPNKKKSTGCVFAWQFPLYHGGLNRGLRTATDGNYGIEFTVRPYKWINDNSEPVIIGVGCDHYLVAIATGAVRKWWGEKKYFLVVDNGYTTGDDGKTYKYFPYWKKYNAFDLHYGVKRLN